MLRLSCKVEIRGDQTWLFNAMTDCTIVTDTATLTDTCHIRLPKKIKWEGQPGMPVKKGDQIRVWLGYNETLTLLFEGFIRKVSAGTPVSFECEDNMFRLKTAGLEMSPEEKSIPDATLDVLIERLLQGTGFKHQVTDNGIRLGTYRITRNTVAEELAELQKEYGLMTYFRVIGGKAVLYAGFSYPADNRTKEAFIYNQNIVSEKLEYRSQEEIKLKVKAVSVREVNGETQRETVEVGDKDGELRTVYRYGLTKEELEKHARAELDRFKYSGFQGSFVTFGEPVIHKADIAYIENKNGDKGNYQIKKVETKFGTAGYRQTITLGPVIRDLNSNIKLL